VKKLLVGCLVILVLGAVLFAVGGYYLYRAASPVIQNARDYLDRFSQLGELEKQIANQTPYTAPQNGELSKEQVDRFARVQQHVRGALGQRFEEIDAKYNTLKAEADGTEQPPVRETFGALGELAGVLVDARRAQVKALNQERFSSAEYRWVRSRVYQAAGIEATSAIDLQKIAEVARKGTGIDSIEVPKTSVVTVPAKNRALVKPHLEQMDEWLPLLFFGL
jgi:hypothetical protein